MVNKRTAIPPPHIIRPYDKPDNIVAEGSVQPHHLRDRTRLLADAQPLLIWAAEGDAGEVQEFLRKRLALYLDLLFLLVSRFDVS